MLDFINLEWPWLHGSWKYNYLCNQCLSPLMFWVQIPIRAKCTTVCDKVCQGLATGLWFFLGPLVSSTNKTDRHDITVIEILLKVALNTIKQTNKQTNKQANINLDVSFKLSSSKWIYVASIRFYNHLSMEKMKLKIIMVYTFYSIPKCYLTQFLSCTCSVWAGKLHWLDTFLLYTVTDQYVALLVPDSCWATVRNGNSISAEITEVTMANY